MALLPNDQWHTAVDHCVHNPGHHLTPYTDDGGTVQIRCDSPDGCGFDTAAPQPQLTA